MPEVHSGRVMFFHMDRQTLITWMAEKHHVPPLECIQVPLENGTKEEGVDGYHQCPGDVVTIQAWSFEQMIQEYLLNIFLFGNTNNLVNADNPWGKYIPTDPNDKEMLASYWYSKMWDENITDPNTIRGGGIANITSFSKIFHYDSQYFHNKYLISLFNCFYVYLFYHFELKNSYKCCLLNVFVYKILKTFEFQKIY